ncbi:MAG TPA: hypothetical protein VFC46_05160 [Humisphaera sp.]|nr:hypothetical protein [Humisphaera sp.]
MPKEYFLYTVRGVRELYYAAVDWESGQVWTAPTKDVADRLAREAGFDSCREEVISKDDLMRSLGFGRTMKLRPSDDEKPKTALFTDREPEPDPSKAKSGAASPWFVPGNGQIELGAAERFPQVPRPLKSGKKSGRGGKKGSPFAASRPIAPGSSDGEDADDVLIVPSSELPDAPKATFSDQAPPVVEDGEE